MIGNAVRDLLTQKEERFFIPIENVAHVMASNPLNHALLVLTKVGYSQIPVVDKDFQLVGMIRLSAIVDKMLSLQKVDPNNIDQFKVEDVMDREVPVLRDPYDIEDVLHLLVDANFLPVVNQEREFLGIVTRREVLKAVNRLAHQLEVKYTVSPVLEKTPCTAETKIS